MKNYQEIKSVLSTLSINKLIQVRDLAENLREKAVNEQVEKVKVNKLPKGGTELEFKGRRYELQNHAYNGRLRVYSRVPGQKPGTFKRGKVLITEYNWGIRMFRHELAFGQLQFDRN